MASFSDGVIADSVAVLNLELRGPAPSGEANHAARKAVVDQINSDPSIPLGVKGAIDKLARVEANIESLRTICWEKDGIAGMPVLDIILERLCTRSMIAGTEQASGGSPLVTVEPFPSNFLETDNWDKLLDDVVEYVLSAYVIIRPEGGRWRIESPLSNTSVVLHDPETFRLVMTLVRPHSGRELRALSKRSCSRLLLPTLAFAGILHDVDKDDPGDKSLWDYHDLLFHSRSRLGRHGYGYGGTFRGIGSYPAPDAVMPIAYEKRVSLPRPNIDHLRESDPPFARVLEDRRSIRQFGDAPLRLEQLGEFLFRSCRTKAVSSEAGEWQTALRPSPGGGAVHELEVYPLIRQCEGISSGLYYYHPQRHELCLVQAPNAATERLLQSAWYTLGKAGHPPVLFLITARFDRVFWKYESMGYALVLKDLGALYQTMYLTATAMGLASCALGGGDSDLFAEASGRPYYREGAVGEFVLGTRSTGVKNGYLDTVSHQQMR
ncbi:SagB family peptide dehydrogenase [Bradyrhizobium sp. 156]|uniref:SagB/ThcOx family dehydrogenase n=1 Tax=Bradyrhizobium sp. 156 TaxID=2782630 RepID=UPI001FF86121|nr:SagB family peptide dehydrogenase [Bradyrhizobium sp. 156]MCK1326517.1 SagB family peptide dehydrogenase [Bradyrhizobium sp. 156]